MTGAGVFVGMYPAILPLIQILGDEGKVVLPESTGIPAVVWILLIIGITAVVGQIFQHTRPVSSDFPENIVDSVGRQSSWKHFLYKAR